MRRRQMAGGLAVRSNYGQALGAGAIEKDLTLRPVNTTLFIDERLFPALIWTSWGTPRAFGLPFLREGGRLTVTPGPW